MSNPSDIGTIVHHHSSNSEDEEDESLSLSDLPLLSSVRHPEDENQEHKERLEFTKSKTASQDFDFGSLVASLDALESEMCIADEVFYRGKILPFRHSVSSACTITAIPCNLMNRSVCRSESMDRIVGSGFRSSSTASTSRSSSTRSSSINSSASADKLSKRHSNYNSKAFQKRSSKLQDQLESSRIPRPCAGVYNGPRRSTSSATSPMKKSALWEIFRLGLVQTPEIELDDLKFRYGKHHGNGRRNSDVVVTGNRNGNDDIVKKSKKQGMKFMSSCKCSVAAVEPEKAGRQLVGTKTKTKVKKEGDKRKRKQEVTRHHRTFEWLRDLSHAAVLNDV